MLLRLVAVLTFAASAAHARADSACSVVVTGAVEAKFSCTVRFVTKGDGAVRIVVAPGKLPTGIKAALPGEVELPPPVSPQIYAFDRLPYARVLFTSARRGTFVAEKQKKARAGEVTVTLRRAEHIAPGHDLTPSLSGRIEARLVPAPGSKTRGEARLTVTF